MVLSCIIAQKVKTRKPSESKLVMAIVLPIILIAIAIVPLYLVFFKKKNNSTPREKNIIDMSTTGHAKNLDESALIIRNKENSESAPVIRNREEEEEKENSESLNNSGLQQEKIYSYILNPNANVKESISIDEILSEKPSQMYGNEKNFKFEKKDFKFEKKDFKINLSECNNGNNSDNDIETNSYLSTQYTRRKNTTQHGSEELSGSIFRSIDLVN